MEQSATYEKARARAQEKYRFYAHAIIFVLVMTLLVVINMLTSPGVTWSIWPLLGWGLALAVHAARVFLLGGEGRLIDALTEQELKRSGSKDHGQSH